MCVRSRVRAESSGSGPSGKHTCPRPEPLRIRLGNRRLLSRFVPWRLLDSGAGSQNLVPRGRTGAFAGGDRCAWPGGSREPASGAVGSTLTEIAQNWSPRMVGIPVAGPALRVTVLKTDAPPGLERIPRSRGTVRPQRFGGHRGEPALPPGQRDPQDLAPPSRVSAGRFAAWGEALAVTSSRVLGGKAHRTMARRREAGTTR